MKQKKRCPICNRMLQERKFVYNPVKKTDICKMCDKRIGHNIFYTPPEKRRMTKTYSRVSKYGMTNDEQTTLYNNLIAEGLSQEQANERIKGDLTFLKSQPKVHSPEFLDKKKIKEKQKQDKIMKDKLLRGLKGK